MKNNSRESSSANFEEVSADLDRMYMNLPDEELRRISEDFYSSALEVGKALGILQERKKSRGYDADKTPIDFIK